MRRVDARAHSLPPRRCDGFSNAEELVREALHFGVTGPSVVRFGAADLKSHRSGQRWSFVAGCPELPRAVSGCLVPAATFFHVPVNGCFPLVL